MSSKLLYTLLASGALLVAGQVSADADRVNQRLDAAAAPAAPAPPANASFVPSDLAAKSHEEVAANPAKKRKKAKAAAVAKGSQVNITGTGAVTGPASLTGGAVAKGSDAHVTGGTVSGTGTITGPVSLSKSAAADPAAAAAR